MLQANEKNENNENISASANHKIETITPTVSTISHHHLFWSIFWLTIIFLLSIYVFAKYQMLKKIEEPRIEVNNQGLITVAKQFADEIKRHLPENFQKIDEELLNKTKQPIEQSIEQKIDASFEQVYKQIPALADFHYSLTGEYTEIAAILSASSESTTNQILFEQSNFDANLEKNLEQVQKEAIELLAKAVRNINSYTQQSLQLSNTEIDLINKTLALTLEDTKQRFSYTLTTLRVAGVGVAGAGSALLVAGGGKLLAKTVSKKAATKVLAKLAAKTAIKATGIGGGAAAGAAIGGAAGSVVPLVGNAAGAVVGGVIGGVAAWVATDKIIIEVDEYLNRPEFEAELKALIDEQKNTIKTDLKALYAKTFAQIAEQHKTALKEKITVKELIEGK